MNDPGNRMVSRRIAIAERIMMCMMCVSGRTVIFFLICFNLIIYKCDLIWEYSVVLIYVSKTGTILSCEQKKNIITSNK